MNTSVKRDKDVPGGGVTLVLLAWTFLESVWSIAITLRDGLATYPYPFIVTGSFHNPAPFGALNAIGLATAAAVLVGHRKRTDLFSKILHYLSVAVILPASIVLFASRSRAAWIGLLVALLVLLLRETSFKGWIRRHRAVGVGAICLVVLAGIAMFQMKKDSAIGRLHLWHMECRVIAGHPWTGVGLDKVFKAYGDTQADYFRQAKRPAAIVRVAGSPVYAFNEYLKFGMAWGIGGLLLSIALAAWVLWRLLRRRSALAYGALVFALFAFASFPLSVVQLQGLGIALLAVALAPQRESRAGWMLWGVACCAFVIAALVAYPEHKARRSAERTWRASLFAEQDTSSYLALYPSLYPLLKDEQQFLYHYGYLLGQTGALEESNAILQQGADISCDPVFLTTLAENHIDQGDYEQAEKELLQAYWMVPARKSTLLRLQQFYLDTGRPSDSPQGGPGGTPAGSGAEPQ